MASSASLSLLALLVAVPSALGGAACWPRRLAEIRRPTLCGTRAVAPLPPKLIHWHRDRDGALLSSGNLPYFATDQPAPDPHVSHSFTFDPHSVDVNELSPLGIAALDEIAPSLLGMDVSIEVSISGARGVRNGADGAARALSIRRILLDKGIRPEIIGSGWADTGEIELGITIRACDPGPLPHFAEGLHPALAR